MTKRFIDCFQMDDVQDDPNCLKFHVPIHGPMSLTIEAVGVLDKFIVSEKELFYPGKKYRVMVIEYHPEDKCPVCNSNFGMIVETTADKIVERVCDNCNGVGQILHLSQNS